MPGAGCMRRYLFVITMTFAVVVIFFENLGAWLVADSAMPLSGIRSCEGKVLRIEKTSGAYKLRVRLDDSGENVLLRYYDELEEPEDIFRSVIKFEAELNLPSAARNPHCFDYRRYLRSEGIGMTAVTDNIDVIGRNYSLYDRYLRYLESRKKSFCESLDERLRGTVMGVIFGETSYMSEEVYEVFRRNGTAHILAVSGLHIGIFYSVFKKLNGRRKSIPGLAVFVFVLFSYGALASWSPSVIRATAMVLMSLAAKTFCLRYDRLTAASAIALALMLYNPYILHSVAFQMSFLAVAAIDIFTKIMPPAFPDSVKTALAVNSAFILYQAYVFNCVSIVSFFLNLPVIFISGIFVPLAVFCFASHCVLGITAPFIPVLTFLGDGLIRINEMAALGGRGAFDVVSPPMFAVLFTGLAAAVICSETFEIYRLRGEKRRIITILVLIVILSAASEALNHSAISSDDMVFIDVGQGSATHIRDGDSNVLIDGGGSYSYNVGKNILKQYFLKNGENRVDLALATHKDMDHYKGLTELKECFNVKNFFDDAVMGDVYKVSDGLRIVTLWPKEKYGTTDDENSNSSVFLIEHGGVRTLITGDMGAEGEEEMIEYYRSTGREDLLDVDILNVGHHGSKSSTSEALLDVTVPSLCVIQVGKNNYGHPSQEVLDRIRDRGIAVFRNDECGAIGIRLSNGRIREVHRMIGERD